MGLFSAPRSRALERLESPDTADDALTRLFDFHARLARWTGGDALVHAFLRQGAPLWTGPVSVLVMGCGRGDLARSVVTWGRNAGLEIRAHGVDRDARFIRLARAAQGAATDVTFETRALDDAFFLQGRQFDYAVSAMALHREDDATAARFLKTANRIARRGLICLDWERDPRARLLTGLFATLNGDPDVRHDARVAVQRGFSASEAEALRVGAGLEFARMRRHPGGRFTIEGERGLVGEPAFAPMPGLAT